ncbi:MAG: acylphosphatase [Rhodospirillaceae bacterium]
MAETAVHVVISGRVQGVWYRGWTLKQATALDLSGWVRNRREGTVEAVFQGEASAVADMLARCRQGPPAAKVTDVQSREMEPEVFGGFRQSPTV